MCRILYTLLVFYKTLVFKPPQLDFKPSLNAYFFPFVIVGWVFLFVCSDYGHLQQVTHHSFRFKVFSSICFFFQLALHHFSTPDRHPKLHCIPPRVKIIVLLHASGVT